MTPTTCPNGHVSAATDYCDTCGAPIAAAGGSSPVGGAGAGISGGGAGAAPSGTPPSPSTPPDAPRTCPSCGVDNRPDALFCEACGYDFTTGAMPRAASALDLATPPPGPAVTTPGPAAPPGPETTPPATGGPVPAAPVPLAPPVPLEWVVEVWVDPDWYALQEADEPCPSPGLPTIVPLAVRSVLVGRASRSRGIHPEVDCTPDVGVSRRHAQLTTDGTRWWIEDLQSSNGTFVGSGSGALPTQPLEPGTRRELHEGDRIYAGAWTRLVVRRATDDERTRHH